MILDLTHGTIELDHGLIELSAREIEVLTHLAGGNAYRANSQTTMVIYRLRKKLTAHGQSADLIACKRGIFTLSAPIAVVTRKRKPMTIPAALRPTLIRLLEESPDRPNASRLLAAIAD